MAVKANATIDLNALKVAGESNKYVTYINDEGVRVHEANDTSNYSLINASGMEVYQGGVSAAQFGSITRIGLEDEASITLSSDSIMGRGLGGIEYFNFQSSSNTVTTNRIKRVNSTVFPGSANTAMTAVLNDFSTGSAEVIIKAYATNDTGGMALSLTYGTSKSGNSTITLNNNSYSVTCTYDGANTFSVYSSELNALRVRGEMRITYSVATIAPGYSLGVGVASGGYALTEGYSNTASGNYSHAEGRATEASGDYSHAEGRATHATEECSHAEGYTTTASGYCSHAEGYTTTASGYYSHAEGGHSTTADGSYSHAEGYNTTANGNYSHASGYYTIAEGEAQTVIGRNNSISSNDAFIIGNGTGQTTASRKNILAVDWNGNVNIASGAKYKINGNALAASDVGAVSTSDVSTTGGANKIIKSNSSGNVTITGSLTLGGHTTSIGSTLTATNSADVSISAGGTKTLATLSNLPIGTWVIECNIRFSNEANGIRRGGLLASGSNLGTSNMDFQVGAATTASFIKQTFTKVITTTAITTYNLIGYSSVAVTVGAGEANIKAVRLC